MVKRESWMTRLVEREKMRGKSCFHEMIVILVHLRNPLPVDIARSALAKATSLKYH